MNPYLKTVIDIILTKRVLGSLIVIIFAIIFSKVINKFVDKLFIKGKNKFEIKRRTSIINLFKSCVKVLVTIIAGLIILDFYGVDTRSLITSLGVLGVVLGLALQDTARDFIGGISLIWENYLQVGDIVTFNNFTGEVISLDLRTTKIRAFNGEVMIVANRNIDAIINASQHKSHLYMEIDTAYEEDCEKVYKVLKEVINEAIKDKVILSDSGYLGINELSSSSVKYIIHVHCEQDSRYGVKREMLKRIKVAYDKNNIKIPYNQIEVHNGKKI